MIYDAFTFFNEYDLLDLRLNILGTVVDKFVIVEASRTFQGWRKPWNFEEQSSRYKDFLDRIIYVKVEDLPIADMDAWHNEWHQRNAIMRGLADARPDDLILTGDCDEIPNPKAIKDVSHPVILIQRHHYYYLNVADLLFPWTGTRMCRMEHLDEPQKLRDSGEPHKIREAGYRSAPAGWHWSYLGGAEAIQKKIQSFSHGEVNKPEYVELDRILEKLRNLTDLFDRPGDGYHKVPIDDSYPQYLRDNLDKYKHLILE